MNIFLQIKLFIFSTYLMNDNNIHEFSKKFHNEYFRTFASDSEMEVINGGWMCEKKQSHYMDYEIENRNRINIFELAIEMFERQMMQGDMVILSWQ